MSPVQGNLTEKGKKKVELMLLNISKYLTVALVRYDEGKSWQVKIHITIQNFRGPCTNSITLQTHPEHSQTLNFPSNP
jgi:hypothetical protein